MQPPESKLKDFNWFFKKLVETKEGHLIADLHHFLKILVHCFKLRNCREVCQLVKSFCQVQQKNIKSETFVKRKQNETE